MAKFEVHIPAPDEGGFNVTLKVDADNWMAALKAGLTKIGEQGSSVQNVMVDMQDDNSIHITEPRSNRVFRIREISEEEAAKAPVKRPGSGIRKPATLPPTPAPAAKPQPDLSAAKTFIGAPPMDLKLPDSSEAKTPPHGVEAAAPSGGVADQTVDRVSDKTPVPGPAHAEPPTEPPPKKAEAKKPDPAQFEKTLEKVPPRATPAPAAQPISKPKHQGVKLPKGASKSSPRFVEELEHPTLPVDKPIGRQRPKSSPGMAVPPAEPNVEDMLEDVFERVQEIHSKKTVDDALYFLLDLAMEKVPADAGSVFRADAASGDLSFIAARGPKAKELVAQKIIVPAGEGIAGFCATEGVSVAISDVQRDPRYFKEVAARVDYETRSVVCSPMMTHGRSFGCIQLINRAGAPHFAEHEVGIVSYLAHQAALYLNNYG
jgi:GAF domain